MSKHSRLALALGRLPLLEAEHMPLYVLCVLHTSATSIRATLLWMLELLVRRGVLLVSHFWHMWAQPVNAILGGPPVTEAQCSASYCQAQLAQGSKLYSSNDFIT